MAGFLFCMWKQLFANTAFQHHYTTSSSFQWYKNCALSVATCSLKLPIFTSLSSKRFGFTHWSSHKIHYITKKLIIHRAWCITISTLYKIDLSFGMKFYKLGLYKFSQNLLITLEILTFNFAVNLSLQNSYHTEEERSNGINFHSNIIPLFC